jgi:endoglycosylceramidase
VNVANLLPPYHPAAAGFDAEHATWLASEGFNTVRLGFMWKPLEPEPGSYDDDYLEEIARTAQMLGRRGIHVLLEFHQDMWNERFGGVGAPDWAVQDDGLPAFPKIGFPANYLVIVALWRAFDHFWANDPGPDGVGLQDRFAAAWRHVAERFRDENHVFGYDIFNEPFPGSAAIGTLLRRGTARFDRRLGAFFRRVIGAIRDADPSTLVFYEPGVLFSFGVDLHDGAGAGDPNTGLSFHSYCAAASPGTPNLPRRAQGLFCPWQEQRTFDRSERHSRRNDVALLLSEFGATDDLHALTRTVEMADRSMLSWKYWAYAGHGDSSGESIVHDLRRPPTAENLKQEKLDVLVRPYPYAVAGTPLRFGFDRDSREFELVYTTRRVNGGRALEGGLTGLVLPARQYPAGYSVEVEGGQVESPADAARLELSADPERDRVRVRVLPR